MCHCTAQAEWGVVIAVNGEKLRMIIIIFSLTYRPRPTFLIVIRSVNLIGMLRAEQYAASGGAVAASRPEWGDLVSTGLMEEKRQCRHLHL